MILHRYTDIYKFLLGIIIFSCLFALPAQALDIDAKGVILIDAESGKVLYEKNSTQSMPPASTTKILTALVALENGNLSQEIKVGNDFVNPGEAGIFLTVGETHSLENLLYALLLRSANDAAVVIAEGISGSQEAFVAKMNEKSQALGLKSSTWKNVHGLYMDGHLTSAYDLSMIARAAMKNPQFEKIVATKEWTMPWQGNSYNRVLYNRNQFLSSYEGADGIKTGQTTQSGSCLVASATRNGIRLIGVLLDSSNMYEQMTEMMDYGFKNFQKKELGKKGDVMGTVQVKQGSVKELNAVLETSPYLIFNNNGGKNISKEVKLDKKELLAPIQAGEKLGMVVYSDEQGNKLESALIAPQNVEKHTLWFSFKKVFNRIWNIAF